MRGRPQLFLLLLLLSSLCACLIVPTPGMTDGGRELIEEERLEFAVVGRTTRREVLLRLGEPDLAAPDGSAILYYWVVIPAVLIIAAGNTGAVLEFSTPHAVLVEFDQQGLVRAIDRRAPDPEDLLRSSDPLDRP